MKTIVLAFSFLFVSFISYSNYTQPLPIDSTETEQEFNLRQYKKMITQADKYFDKQIYDKAEKLYQRAINFQPDYDNTYPKQQIEKIKSINNQIYIAKYNRTFSEGLTEFRVNQKTDRYGDVIKYTIVSVIVQNGKADIYEKTITRYATTYMKNGVAITQYKWSEDTNNPNLKRNE